MPRSGDAALFRVAIRMAPENREGEFGRDAAPALPQERGVVSIDGRGRPHPASGESGIRCSRVRLRERRLRTTHERGRDPLAVATGRWPDFPQSIHVPNPRTEQTDVTRCPSIFEGNLKSPPPSSRLSIAGRRLRIGAKQRREQLNPRSAADVRRLSPCWVTAPFAKTWYGLKACAHAAQLAAVLAIPLRYVSRLERVWNFRAPGAPFSFFGIFSRDSPGPRAQRECAQVRAWQCHANAAFAPPGAPLLSLNHSGTQWPSSSLFNRLSACGRCRNPRLDTSLKHADKATPTDGP